MVALGFDSWLISKHAVRMIVGLLFAVLLSTSAIASSQLNKIEISSGTETKPQLLLSLDSKTEYSLFLLQAPDRLVIDFVDTELTFDLETLALDKSMVQDIRISARNGKDLRVVLDLEKAIDKPDPEKGFSSEVSVSLQMQHDLLEIKAKEKEKKKAVVSQAKIKRSKVEKVKLDKLMMLAKHDDNAAAQNRLATYYFQGRLVDQHHRKAAMWFQKAAKHGLAEAQHNLGIMYSKGLGVDRNYKRAANWLYKAAKQGQAKSQYNLAVMYLQGLGVSKDPKKAAALLRKAAKKDDAKSQYLLGVLYTQGTGVKKSYIKGYAWLTVAERRGVAEASKIKQVILRNMTSTGVRKGRNLADKYFSSYHRKRKKDERTAKEQVILD